MLRKLYHIIARKDLGGAYLELIGASNSRNTIKEMAIRRLGNEENKKQLEDAIEKALDDQDDNENFWSEGIGYDDSGNGITINMIR